MVGILLRVVAAVSIYLSLPNKKSVMTGNGTGMTEMGRGGPFSPQQDHDSAPHYVTVRRMFSGGPGKRNLGVSVPSAASPFPFRLPGGI